MKKKLDNKINIKINDKQTNNSMLNWISMWKESFESKNNPFKIKIGSRIYELESFDTKIIDEEINNKNDRI